MNKPKVLILSSGTKTGGGSGFRKLVEDVLNGVWNVEIVGVVCNRAYIPGAPDSEQPGVWRIAQELGIGFTPFYKGDSYTELQKKYYAPWLISAGWLLPIDGHDASHTINIHPADMNLFGGPGMYGLHLHQAVLDSGATESAVTIHFVDDEYDHGSTICKVPFPVLPGDTAESLQERGKELEHRIYGRVLELVINRGMKEIPSDLLAA